MKARVKATGELIDLPRLTRVYSYEEDESIFFLKDLEILDNIQPDYWTRLEHQYAGMAMQAYIIASHISQFSFCEGDMKNCKSMAHALVEKLKKESK
jgi:hypothetical protein